MASISMMLVLLLVADSVFSLGSVPAYAATKRFKFNVEWTSVTRLCHTKKLLTVNGQYPGPTIAVHEGDNVEIKVTNTISSNATLHWHGIKQLRTGWADGPAYITQCPIRAGQTYTYKFQVTDQRGTLWWHSHIFWQRASVYGALIVYPRMPYPFKPAKVHGEVPVILGEWWNGDVDAVEKQMMLSGAGPNVSDAFTLNGLPGPLYACSAKDTFIQPVTRGKTYLLRIINAALNNEMFFAVANHTLTVVEVDAAYTKPFTTSAIMIAPGQTTSVLLTADQVPDSTGMFAMSLTPYISAPVFPFNNSTAVGFILYNTKRTEKISPRSSTVPLQPLLHNLPDILDTQFAMKFSSDHRSLATLTYPCNVPKTVDKRVITTVGSQLQDCPANKTCYGYEGKRFFSSMNNQSFVRPSIAILQSHYYNLKKPGYTTDFADKPPTEFDFSGVDPLKENMNTEFGSKILSVPHGTNLEIVFQNTNFIHAENHPIHLHGHNFFVVGHGFGNFDVHKHPKSYNLVDPVERNTVAVPTGGWAAIRFKADNPGAWFIHCHLEEHTTWGLATAFIVQNGQLPSQRLLPPPSDLPKC